MIHVQQPHDSIVFQESRDHSCALCSVFAYANHIPDGRHDCGRDILTGSRPIVASPEAAYRTILNNIYHLSHP